MSSQFKILIYLIMTLFELMSEIAKLFVIPCIWFPCVFIFFSMYFVNVYFYQFFPCPPHRCMGICNFFHESMTTICQSHEWMRSIYKIAGNISIMFLSCRAWTSWLFMLDNNNFRCSDAINSRTDCPTKLYLFFQTIKWKQLMCRR